MRLTIAKDVPLDAIAPAPDVEIAEFTALAAEAFSGKIIRRLFDYSSSRLVTPSLPGMTFPLAVSLVLRLTSRGPCQVEDARGGRLAVTPGLIAAQAWRAARDFTRRGALLARVGSMAEDIAAATKRTLRPDLTRPVLYLRTDPALGLACGGSIGHIAGVANNLARLAGGLIFVGYDLPPTLDGRLETHVPVPDPAFADFRELPLVRQNLVLPDQVMAILSGQTPAFIYQRLSRNNLCGPLLAKRLGVPFVAEYNGPEAWIARHWGSPLPYEELTLAVESANLRAADLVVAVSRPMAKELAGRGVDPAKILVNPNGVDTEMYRPDIVARDIRERYGLTGKTVFGFIGTFGPWHGAEVLAQAFVRMLELRPDLRGRVRLALIGDGPKAPLVRDILAAGGAIQAAVFTGAVPQTDGPRHLGACDVLVSPHVPNPDGSPFFGSPTKLFEYMAMGRAIAASNLDQIGEVLGHEHTALLVRPGDPEDLAQALIRLTGDAGLCAALGENARKAALARHTWAAHARAIVAALQRVTS